MSSTPSLADNAYRIIEEMIVTRVFKPGSMISESSLREQLGLGRTPVREALQRLRLEGYVDIHPSRGALVTEVDVRRQLQLLEVRRPLEDLMVRTGAERASSVDRRELERLAEEIGQVAASGDARAFLLMTRSVQEALAAAARNPELVKAIGVVHGLSRRFWYSYIEDENAFEEAAQLYSTTLTAVALRETDKAAQSAGAFLDFLERLTRSAIERL